MKMPNNSGNKIFNLVRLPNVRRTMFDLSYEKKFTFDMGQLIPVMCDEVVPGDFMKIGCQAVVRFQPLVSPVLHEMNLYTWYFFLPTRILDENFETFITGGEDGQDDSSLPVWMPSKTSVGSLWDYFGFPIDITPTSADSDYLPLDYPRLAYNMVYNEYFRNQNLQDEVPLTNEDVLYKNWEQDYFTSSLPFLQRGAAPSLPLSGFTNAQWEEQLNYNTPGFSLGNFATGTGAQGMNASRGQGLGYSSFYMSGNSSSGSDNVGRFVAALNSNIVNFADAGTFDVNDLRTVFQLQKWMERSARVGSRYTEFLRGHYGTNPADYRLMRPEYIGGSKSPVIISEVLQTSSTDSTSPQGNLAGHGVTFNDTYIGKYKANEFGYILGLCALIPRTSYNQGINRQWLRRSRYDFPALEFVNLGEQAVTTDELYWDSNSHGKIFGYQGRYNELRVKPNYICGQMRTVFDYWHLGRSFSSEPLLNSSFIECKPSKRIFAVPSEPGFICSFANNIKAFRPIPFIPEPGYVDHN